MTESLIISSPRPTTIDDGAGLRKYGDGPALYARGKGEKMVPERAPQTWRTVLQYCCLTMLYWRFDVKTVILGVPAGEMLLSEGGW